MKLTYEFIIFFSILFFGKSLGALDASAMLLECDEDATDDIERKEPPYHTINNCKRKIRISLNITNMGKTPPDLDYSFLSQISDPETETNIYLLSPVVLRLRQDQVLLTYPFHYISAVNAKAEEVVINYENRRNFTGCDDTSQINPTCGLKHEKGEPVPFSEGFCCSCPPTPVAEKQVRGGQDCSLNVGDPSDEEKQRYKASAHCLHLSDIWYSVSAVSEPFILHQTFSQVYNLRHMKNGSSVWVALTHDEDFELGPTNTFQKDDNETIVISYLTASPDEKAVTVPIKERRLLTPQPLPAIPLTQLPAPVKNGAPDYILLPKELIEPDGDYCDTSGISFEGFVKQPNRCNVPKDSCLKNQPLEFWEMDNQKRAAGARGGYLLENFAVPYKDPIIVDPETKVHWLATEYHELHRTTLFVELNADDIAVMSVGKQAQISKAVTYTTGKTVDIHVSVLNRGLMPAVLSVQAVDCAYGVPPSKKESITVSPQMTQNVLLTTKEGGTSLNYEFTCTVQVSSEAYNVVAKREVKIDPHSRCVCNFHCECACLSGSLQCEPLSEKDYLAAGFQGSLPILTASPPHKNWFMQHPYLALLAIVLFLLLFGLIKGILGLAGITKIGHFGLNKILYQRKKLKKYHHPELSNIAVVYDDEGYPIHPDTQERVQVVGEEILFVFNLLFLFFWPCLMCKKCCLHIAKSQKKNAGKKAPKMSKDTEDKPPPPSDEKENEDDLKDIEKQRSLPEFKEVDQTAEATDASEEVEKDKIFATRSDGDIPESKIPTSPPVGDAVNKYVERWNKEKLKADAEAKLKS